MDQLLKINSAIAAMIKRHDCIAGIRVADVSDLSSIVVEYNPGTSDDEKTAVMRHVANIQNPSADDVRSECARRMRLLVNARDDRHLDLILANGAREAVRLIRQGAAYWTPEQAERAATLAAVDAEIERLRAISNELESNPPADYEADARWHDPSVGG